MAASPRLLAVGFLPFQTGWNVVSSEEKRMSAEGLRVLVVGDEHELKHMVDTVLDSELVNRICEEGYTPQAITMTTAEWTLRSVDDYLLYLSATCEGAVPAQEYLYRDARHPIASPDSKYLFRSYDVYQQVGAPHNTNAALILAARQVIENHFTDRDNPLVAVVLSDLAAAWAHNYPVWVNQLPDEVAMWRLHDGSDKLTRVRFGAEAQIVRLVG